MTQLSIIIVSYNTKDILANCLNLIDKSDLDKSLFETIIIDNGSNDGSIEMVEKLKSKNSYIKIIRNYTNIGFGAANNKAIRMAKSEYILLLNSDVMVDKDTILKQIQFMKEHLEYSASTCKLMLPDNKMDPACHRGFPTVWASLSYFAKLEKILPKTKIFGQYHQGFLNLDKIHDIDAISGAFFMIKKSVFDKIGLFDEGFFMYGEDLDLCLRIKQHGFKIGFNSDNSAIHLKGKSGRKKTDKLINNSSLQKTNYHFWNAMWLFYQKHYLKKYPRITNLIVKQVINMQRKKYER